MSDDAKALAEQDATIEDVADDSGEDSSPSASPGKIGKNLFSGMEEELKALQIDPFMFVRELPAPVRRRLKALKKLHFEHNKLEAGFYEEVHQLEAKYAGKYSQLYDRRKNIVMGETEPTDSDCEWPSDEEVDEDGAPEGGDTKVKNHVNSDVNGMPDFWLFVLKHASETAELVQSHDEPVLKHLQDVTLKLSPSGQPTTFTLEFHFASNEYFTNTVLSKKYTMRMEPADKELDYEGPQIEHAEGSTIEWKAGKNLTEKTMKKKQKHKKSGVHRTVTKTVPQDSFFNFFTPPSIEEQDEPPNDEVMALVEQDFEVGHFIREQLIPRAVLYYTGDACPEDSDSEFEDSDDGDDDEDDEENMGGRRGHMRGIANGDEKPECKQQ